MPSEKILSSKSPRVTVGMRLVCHRPKTEAASGIPSAELRYSHLYGATGQCQGDRSIVFSGRGIFGHDWHRGVCGARYAFHGTSGGDHLRERTRRTTNGYINRSGMGAGGLGTLPAAQLGALVRGGPDGGRSCGIGASSFRGCEGFDLALLLLRRANHGASGNRVVSGRVT